MSVNVTDWCHSHGFETKIGTWRERYSSAKPFPHLIIDDFFPQEMAAALLSSFPSLEDEVWTQKGSCFSVPGGIAKKYELGDKMSFPSAVTTAFESFVFSEKFIQFLSQVTGIDGLCADSDFKGGARSGGLNAVSQGGMLARHIDFNFSSELQKYRAVNVLVYLNKGWLPSDGGNLELWDKTLTGEPNVITAIFNRCLVFATNDETYHGYKSVLSSEVRKSINLYFYTKNCPPKVNPTPHKTIWKPIQ